MNKKYKNISSANTIIAFDLHEVLVRYDYKEIFRNFWQGKHKIKLFAAFINPFLIYDTVKLFFKDSAVEQYIIWLPKKHPILRQYIPLGIRIANSQKPIPQMLELLRELKKGGYTLHLFSNIGSEIFKDLEKKFPDLFQYFTSFTLPSQENDYLKKPSRRSFENYIAQNNTDNKQIIFIDDKVRNIKMACKCGIIGIRYKSPSQIRKKLITLGVFINYKL